MLLEIEELFDRDNLPPILLMFGEEELLLEEALEKLINKIVKSKGTDFDFEALDANEIKIEQLVDCCNTFPFIAQKRVILVKNFDKLFSTRISKKNIDESPFTKYLNQPQNTSFLILISQFSELNGLTEDIKKNKGQLSKKIQSLKYPYNLLISKFEWIEFSKIYENQLPHWISLRVKQFGKTIDKEAIKFLIATTNPSLRDINNEIQKVLIFIQDRKNINIDDIRTIVGASRVYNIFELQKAIGQRNLKEAIIILQNMISTDKQQMLIMTMLIRYFIVLWKLIEAKDKYTNNYQLASAIGVNYYFLNDYKIALNNYTKQEIDRAFIILAETDEALKSTSSDVFYIMQNLLIKIMDNN